MLSWDNYIYFALPTLGCWLVAIVALHLLRRPKVGSIFAGLGLAIFAVFVTLFWISIQRPPMRTMGETRLWYTLFLSAIGLLLYLKWRYSWILSFSLVVAAVFLLINLLKPEIHSKNLMPALQSVWFVPHVTAYILSYSFLSASAIAAGILLFKRMSDEAQQKLLGFTDNLVYVGFGLLMGGLLMGAIWAKEAWGHYWSWDPKETWAAITAIGYLLYIHLRLRETRSQRFTLWLVIFSFVLLMITWKGVAYLPSAQNSVHVYSN